MKGTFSYRGFGLNIESQFELPELEPTSGGEAAPDVVIRFGAVSRLRRKVTLDEQLAVNQVGAAFLIRKGREITVDVKPGADLASVRAVMLGKIMAFLLRQRGWLPLHASVAAIGGTCVLFLGASGAGKSTTAAALYAAGHTVISDDIGVVRLDDSGRCTVQPAWSHVRLMHDARVVLGGHNLRSLPQIDKHRFDLGQTMPSGPCLVGCICVLEYGDAISMTLYPRSRAAAELSRHSFVRHGNMDREALDAHLKDCAEVVNMIPVFGLQRPRALETLPALVEFVEKTIKAELGWDGGTAANSSVSVPF